MAKKIADYQNHVQETVKAFDEGRVLLVSCGKEGVPNVMAIGWGTMGIIWRRPIFMVLVRPSRYTYKLIEETGEFTVNIVPPKLKRSGAILRHRFRPRPQQIQGKKSNPSPIEDDKNTHHQERTHSHFECRVVNKNEPTPLGLKPGVSGLLT